MYSGLCILRPPILPEKCLKLERGLTMKDTYMQNTGQLPLKESLETEGGLTLEGVHKLQEPLYMYMFLVFSISHR